MSDARVIWKPIHVSERVNDAMFHQFRHARMRSNRKCGVKEVIPDQMR